MRSNQNFKLRHSIHVTEPACNMTGIVPIACGLRNRCSSALQVYLYFSSTTSNRQTMANSEAVARKNLSVVTDKKGAFVRKASEFRNWIKKDGTSGFPPAKGRYHLYVSMACPWAHRTLILRSLKGLEDVISVDVVDHVVHGNGWEFPDKDTVMGKKYMREIYESADPTYSGRWTVPVLFDKQTKTIVNNESAEIIQMLNSEFNEFCAKDEQRAIDLYPEDLRPGIDEINGWVYETVNNGVYRSGFAQSQEAYEEAVIPLFQSLDKAEEILSKNKYLLGSKMTLADVRLFTTLVRFDSVYVRHFKCNLRRIVDYPNLWGYLKELYQIEDFRKTTDLKQIKEHYFKVHTSVNPYGIVPVGPIINFDESHGRDQM